MYVSKIVVIYVYYKVSHTDIPTHIRLVLETINKTFQSIKFP